jgi:threonine/homoserine/homoserine lactone efflux protein
VAAVAVLNATPGVDLLLAVSRTLQGGLRAGLAASLGIGAGCLVHALAAGLGLAALLAMHPGAFRALQWAGAGYLFWLGAGLLRDAWRGGPSQAPAADVATTSLSLAAEFRRGLLTNVLNPKVAFFFLAFLPPFVPASSPQRTVSFLLLGAWFAVQGTFFLFGIVAMSARVARWQTSVRTQRALTGIGGILFIGLALRLMFDARKAGA